MYKKFFNVINLLKNRLFEYFYKKKINMKTENILYLLREYIGTCEITCNDRRKFKYEFSLVLTREAKLKIFLKKALFDINAENYSFITGTEFDNCSIEGKTIEGFEICCDNLIPINKSSGLSMDLYPMKDVKIIFSKEENKNNIKHHFLITNFIHSERRMYIKLNDHNYTFKIFEKYDSFKNKIENSMDAFITTEIISDSNLDINYELEKYIWSICKLSSFAQRVYVSPLYSARKKEDNWLDITFNVLNTAKPNLSEGCISNGYEIITSNEILLSFEVNKVLSEKNDEINTEIVDKALEDDVKDLIYLNKLQKKLISPYLKENNSVLSPQSNSNINLDNEKTDKLFKIFEETDEIIINNKNITSENFFSNHQKEENKKESKENLFKSLGISDILDFENYIEKCFPKYLELKNELKLDVLFEYLYLYNTTTIIEVKFLKIYIAFEFLVDICKKYLAKQNKILESEDWIEKYKKLDEFFDNHNIEILFDIPITIDFSIIQELKKEIDNKEIKLALDKIIGWKFRSKKEFFDKLEKVELFKINIKNIQYLGISIDNITNSDKNKIFNNKEDIKNFILSKDNNSIIELFIEFLIKNITCQKIGKKTRKLISEKLFNKISKIEALSKEVQRPEPTLNQSLNQIFEYFNIENPKNLNLIFKQRNKIIHTGLIEELTNKDSDMTERNQILYDLNNLMNKIVLKILDYDSFYLVRENGYKIKRININS